MEYGAIDLHKKESQIQIVTETGEIIDRQIATTLERLTHVFGGRPRIRIVVEASTESEWVAQHLEQMLPEVIVADTNYGPMYSPAESTDQDRSPRRRRAERSLSARDVSVGAPAVCAAARGPVSVECPPGADPGPHTGDFLGAQHHTCGRVAHSQRPDGNLSRAARRASVTRMTV
jgi:hypothetical protein